MCKRGARGAIPRDRIVERQSVTWQRVDDAIRRNCGRVDWRRRKPASEIVDAAARTGCDIADAAQNLLLRRRDRVIDTEHETGEGRDLIPDAAEVGIEPIARPPHGRNDETIVRGVLKTTERDQAFE